MPETIDIESLKCVLKSAGIDLPPERLQALLPAAERANAESVADEHLASALPHIAGDYMGEHWLASFALLALLPETVETA